MAGQWMLVIDSIEVLKRVIFTSNITGHTMLW
jgi:hypothetical protein